MQADVTRCRHCGLPVSASVHDVAARPSVEDRHIFEPQSYEPRATEADFFSTAVFFVVIVVLALTMMSCSPPPPHEEATMPTIVVTREDPFPCSTNPVYRLAYERLGATCSGTLQ